VPPPYSLPARAELQAGRAPNRSVIPAAAATALRIDVIVIPFRRRTRGEPRL